jgi:hypothetical protein
LEPVWARGGSELFYRGGNRREKMIRVAITAEPSLRVLERQLLFEGDFGFGIPPAQPNYDVAPDGGRFVMVKTHRPAPTELHFILNWFEELRERAPIPKE